MIRASIGVLAIARVASAEPPFRIGAEPWVGAELRHRFGETLVEGLALDLVPSAIDARAMIEVSISHTVASYRGRATDPYGVVAPLSYALEQRELIVGAVALRRFTDEEGRLIPLLGGGPLIAHLHNREAIATTTQTMFGLEGIAGVDVRLGPGLRRVVVPCARRRPGPQLRAHPRHLRKRPRALGGDHRQQLHDARRLPLRVLMVTWPRS